MIEQLAAGTLPPGSLSDKVAAYFTPERLERIAAWLQELGPLRSVALLERTTKGESRGYRYRYAFPNETLLVNVAYDKAGKVEQLNFRPE
jgi:D-alanyl-D-alanine carboxypeptidase